MRIRVGLVLGAVAIVVGTYLTGTRGALVGVVALLLWLVACRTAIKPPLKLLVVGVAAIAVMIVTGAIDQMAHLLDFGSRSTGTLTGRTPLWENARAIWSENFWFGGGAWASRATAGVDAHNVILEFGSALGVVGVVIFVLLVWASLRLNRSATNTQTLILGGFIAVIAAPYLSGAWETSPAAWIALASFAQLQVLRGSFEPPRTAPKRARSAAPARRSRSTESSF